MPYGSYNRSYHKPYNHGFPYGGAKKKGTMYNGKGSQRSAFTRRLITAQTPQRSIYGLGHAFNSIVSAGGHGKGGFAPRLDFAVTAAQILTIGITGQGTNLKEFTINCGNPERANNLNQNWQPRYWDQYGLIYKHFWITQCKITCKFRQVHASVGQEATIITNLKPAAEGNIDPDEAIADRQALELHDKALYSLSAAGNNGDQFTVTRLINIANTLARPRSRSLGQGTFRAAGVMDTTHNVLWEVYSHPRDHAQTFLTPGIVAEARMSVTWYGTAYDLVNVGESVSGL